MGRRVFVAVLAALVVLAPTAAVAEDGPFIPTTDFLPPIAPDGPGVDRAEECGDDGLVCVRWVEQELAEWESYFGCDHRAVFPTVYRLLTRETRLVLEDDPSFFDDPAGLGYEALKFYELYLEMITAHLAGEEIPPAWQTAMDAANEGDYTAGHDMLLAINAHVQRDMPFAVSAAGLNIPDGSSRKADHDRFNQVLNMSYDTIVAEMGRRYDPFMTTVDEVGGLVDNVGAQQLVALWREGVWRNAEQVTTTADTPLFDLSVRMIETQADTTAQLMTVGELPGRRALRDAHCAAALAAEAEEANGAPEATDEPRSVPQATPAPAAAPSEEGTDTAADTGSLPATGAGSALAALALLAGAPVTSRHDRRG